MCALHAEGVAGTGSSLCEEMCAQVRRHLGREGWRERHVLPLGQGAARGGVQAGVGVQG